MNLSSNVKLTLVNTAVAAAQNPIESAGVNMSDFEGVMFVVLVGAVTPPGVLTAAARVSDDNNGDYAAPASGAISTTANASGTFVIVNVYRPLHRYVECYLTIASANVAVGGILAIQYGPKKKPTVHDATTLAHAVLAADAK